MYEIWHAGSPLSTWFRVGKGGNMPRTLIAALAGAALIAAIAASAAPAGALTECNGVFTNTTLSGGVVVNPGDSCELENVIVNGGLTVNGGGFGAFLSVNNSTINGGWSITGIIFRGSFCGNNVGGGLTVTDTELFGFPLSFGELNAGCAGGTINGSVTIRNNDGPVEIDGYRLNGALAFSGIDGFLNELEATAVRGTATCENVVDDGTSAPLVNSYTGRNAGCPV